MNGYSICNHIKGTNWLVYTRLLSQFCWKVGRTTNLGGPPSVSLRNMGLPKTFVTSNYSLLRSKQELRFRRITNIDYISEVMKRKECYVNRSSVHYPYSTIAYENLSLANDKVQMYLNTLKNQYENALNYVDDANVETMKTLKPVMQLLEEVSQYF